MDSTKKAHAVHPVWQQSPLCCTSAWQLFSCLVDVERMFFTCAASRPSSPPELLPKAELSVSSMSTPLLGLELCQWSTATARRLCISSTSPQDLSVPPQAGVRDVSTTTNAAETSLCVTYSEWFSSITSVLETSLRVFSGSSPCGGDGEPTSTGISSSDAAAVEIGNAEVIVLDILMNLTCFVEQEAPWLHERIPHSSSLFAACELQRQLLCQWIRHHPSAQSDAVANHSSSIHKIAPVSLDEFTHSLSGQHVGSSNVLSLSREEDPLRYWWLECDFIVSLVERAKSPIPQTLLDDALSNDPANAAASPDKIQNEVLQDMFSHLFHAFVQEPSLALLDEIPTKNKTYFEALGCTASSIFDGSAVSTREAGMKLAEVSFLDWLDSASILPWQANFIERMIEVHDTKLRRILLRAPVTASSSRSPTAEQHRSSNDDALRMFSDLSRRLNDVPWTERQIREVEMKHPLRAGESGHAATSNAAYNSRRIHHPKGNARNATAIDLVDQHQCLRRRFAASPAYSEDIKQLHAARSRSKHKVQPSSKGAMMASVHLALQPSVRPPTASGFLMGSSNRRLPCLPI